MITLSHLFNERTMSSVQYFFSRILKISDNLSPMRSSSSSVLLDVHSSPKSYYDVTLQQNGNANDNITIEFIYLSDDSVPSAVPSYSYCFTSNFENFANLSPLSRRRARTHRRIVRRRRQPKNKHRTPQSSVSRTSPTPNVDAARSGRWLSNLWCCAPLLQPK